MYSRERGQAHGASVGLLSAEHAQLQLGGGDRRDGDWPRGVSRERAQLDEWNRELRIRLMR